MNHIANLMTRKNQLIADATAELEKNGHGSKRYKGLVSETETLQSDIDMLNQIERSGAVKSAPVAISAPAIITETSATERSRINTAYRTALRHGLKSARPELRDLKQGVDADGGALIPQGWDGDWVEALKQSSGIDQLVHSYNTGDRFRPVKTVQVNTTSTNLTYVPENTSTTSAGAVQTPAVVSQIQNSDNLVLRVTLSWDELDDAFDVLGWLKRSIAPIVSRGLSWALLTGTDPATSTALPNSPDGGLTKFAPTGFSQSALADGIGLTNLINLRSQLSYAYQFGPNSGFVASETTANYMAAQLNAIDEPLYKRDPNTNLLLIDGSPLYVAQAGSMPAYTVANSNPIVFAAFDRAYAFAQTNPRFQVLEINPNQLTSDVVISLQFASTGLFSSALTAFTTAAS